MRFIATGLPRSCALAPHILDGENDAKAEESCGTPDPISSRMRATLAARHTIHPAMHIYEYEHNGAACRHPLHSYGDSVTGGGMS